MVDKGVPREGYRVYKDGEPIGEVTSGTLSPLLGIGIGIAFVKPEYAVPGVEIEVEIRGASPRRRSQSLRPSTTPPRSTAPSGGVSFLSSFLFFFPMSKKHAVLAVLLWSTVASAFKLSLRYLTPLQLLFYASLTSLLVFGLLHSREFSLDRRNLRSAYLGLINPFLYYLVLFSAYDRLPPRKLRPSTTRGL